MSAEPFKPSPTGAMLVQGNKIVGHVSYGGDLLLMPMGNRNVLFEIHPYHGPAPLNKKTLEPLNNIPAGFWDAVDRWIAGGQLVDGDLCVVGEWCMACNGSGEEARHIGGGRYSVAGCCKACNGTKLEGQ